MTATDINSITSDDRVSGVHLHFGRWENGQRSASLTAIGALYGKEVSATAYRTDLETAIRDVRRQLDEAFQRIERGN